MAVLNVSAFTKVGARDEEIRWLVVLELGIRRCETDLYGVFG
jgi:hypothetical protein